MSSRMVTKEPTDVFPSSAKFPGLLVAQKPLGYDESCVQESSSKNTTAMMCTLIIDVQFPWYIYLVIP